MQTTQGSELFNLFTLGWVPPPESAANKGEEVIREMGGDWAGHPGADHLKAYALRQLPRGHSIIVDFHLRMCASCSIQLQEIRASIGHWTGVEKRKSVRVPTDDVAVLTVLGPEPSGHIDTRILDTSKEGLKGFHSSRTDDGCRRPDSPAQLIHPGGSPLLSVVRHGISCWRFDSRCICNHWLSYCLISFEVSKRPSDESTASSGLGIFPLPREVVIRAPDPAWRRC